MRLHNGHNNNDNHVIRNNRIQRLIPLHRRNHNQAQMKHLKLQLNRKEFCERWYRTVLHPHPQTDCYCDENWAKYPTKFAEEIRPEGHDHESQL